MPPLKVRSEGIAVADVVMKVLFISRKWPPAVGSTVTYGVELTDELAKQVELVLHTLPGTEDGMASSGWPVISFVLRTAWLLLTRERGHEVVHASELTLWPLLLLMRLVSPRTVLVMSCHGSDASFAGKGVILAAIFRAYVRLGARLLPNIHVIADSDAAAAAAKARGYARVRVVPLASRPLEPFVSPAPKPYVLFVGRHQEQQNGVRWFVDAVLPLLPADIRLLVAGPLRGARDARKFEPERVRLLGPVRGRALRMLMAEATCVVIPRTPLGRGKVRGFALVAAETAASGGIVFASDVHGLKESLIAGKTGFLLPPLEAQVWARAIRMVIDCPLDERQQFSQGARSLVAEKFSWERVGADTLALYNQASHDEKDDSAWDDARP